MFRWFRERLYNNKPWFRVDIGTASLEGTKHPDGKLVLSIQDMGLKTILMLDKESADKVSSWLAIHYPTRGANVVPFKPIAIVPLPQAPRSPERNPPTPPG